MECPSMYSLMAPASTLLDTNTRIFRSTLPSFFTWTTVFCSLDTLRRTCVCVCVYVCMYVCMYVRIYAKN